MKYASITDVGKVRKLNEDDFYVDKQFQRLFMVADGMGGHNAGDVASKMVINIIKNYYLDNICEDMSIDQVKNELLKAINLANESLLRASNKFENLRNMGTTLNLVYIHFEEILFINIGDSRAYASLENDLSQITVDHSLVEELLKKGEITEIEAKNHPQGNIITSCLGAKGDYKVGVFTLPKEPRMKLLLCTDGLTNLIDKKCIQKIIIENDVYSASKLLVDKAKEYGGFDNITLILIELEKQRDLNG